MIHHDTEYGIDYPNKICWKFSLEVYYLINIERNDQTNNESEPHIRKGVDNI